MIDRNNSENEPKEHLSAFEEGLPDSTFDALPSETDKSEIETVRDTLQRLAEEYGFDYEVYTGRELGHETTLSLRVDALDHASPSGINEMVTQAIQENTITQPQADELFESLTDVTQLDKKNPEQLQALLYSIYQLLEAVIIDPQKLFDSDLQAQSSLLHSLQSAADAIQVYIDNKDQRNQEELPAKSYLVHSLSESLQRRERNLRAHPALVQEIGEYLAEVTQLVELLPEQVVATKYQLGQILRFINESKRIDDENDTLVKFPQALEDAKILLQDLIADEQR